MGKKVLVVDDEKEIADLVEVYLKNDGYEVLKFYNATDALHCVMEEQEPDLAHVSILYKKSRSDNGIICINQITAMPLRLYINYTPIYLPENTLHFPANKNPLGFSNNIFKRFNKCNVCSL